MCVLFMSVFVSIENTLSVEYEFLHWVTSLPWSIVHAECFSLTVLKPLPLGGTDIMFSGCLCIRLRLSLVWYFRIRNQWPNVCRIYRLSNWYTNLFNQGQGHSKVKCIWWWRGCCHATGIKYDCFFLPHLSLAVVLYQLSNNITS